MSISRNSLIQWLMFIAFIVLFIWTQALADARSDAKQALETTINKVVELIKQPGFRQKDTNEAFVNKAEEYIKEIFDFNEFSARTLGSIWKEFTPEEKIEFNNAFAALLRNTYLDKIDEYRGEKVNYLGEIASSKGDKIEVQTAINSENKNVLINYLMLKKDSWKVYDIIVEGVSLVQNYRSQFRELIQKGMTPKELTQKVYEQAKKVKEANNKKNIS
ncbi:MlaC/ttg2D family ABC transporter substrate-binding protein [Desulfovibrio litoralis]|uniref:Phospholipid transport system substrate-binding protein n=1 Tax=Desulfovibrio litoralis DSM 11393 TaxID=1121455 RepID=A0A1M7S6K5_9BACT|nr:ABC transporter substrate-binding protein [Desulfovibrio litoralis]SHN54096.1 phospholipid transport system substrate-binding protein [Desulfovibrio litoralis DSM 11393]